MPERPTYPKSTCCIPGCPRWSQKFPGEWLCARHWKMVPKAWRAVLRRAWKRERTTYDAERANPGPMTTPAADLAYLAARRLWARAKRYVILKEAGH